MTALSDDDLYAEDEAPQPRSRLRYNPGRARGEDAFEAAARHSSRVRLLKFILPALAIAGVVVFWATARIIPGDLASLVSVAGIDTKSNSVTMQAPHISGFEGTRRAYEVKAESAVQNLDDPKVVTFKQIEGKFGLDEAGVATVGAATGIYDGNKNTLMLKDGITVTTTTGYAAKFMQAAIDLAKGSLDSSNPLELSTAEGTIRANGVAVSDRGKHVTFTGGVSVTYMPPDELVTKTGAAGSATGAP